MLRNRTRTNGSAFSRFNEPYCTDIRSENKNEVGIKPTNCSSKGFSRPKTVKYHFVLTLTNFFADVQQKIQNSPLKKSKGSIF